MVCSDEIDKGVEQKKWYDEKREMEGNSGKIMMMVTLNDKKDKNKWEGDEIKRRKL